MITASHCNGSEGINAFNKGLKMCLFILFLAQKLNL